MYQNPRYCCLTPNPLSLGLSNIVSNIFQRNLEEALITQHLRNDTWETESQLYRMKEQADGTDWMKVADAHLQKASIWHLEYAIAAVNRNIPLRSTSAEACFSSEEGFSSEGGFSFFKRKMNILPLRCRGEGTSPLREGIL